MRKFISILSIILCLLMINIPITANSNIAFSKGNSDDKKIALTFDDGPHPRYTKMILEILDKYNIKATFFVIGVNIENYPQTLKSIYEHGHEIGNHSYDHSSEKYIDSYHAEEEIKKCEALIYRELNIIPTVFRPPQGQYSKALENVAATNNYSIVLWNIDTKDWEHNPATSIYKTVTQNVTGGDIILMHDYTSGKNTTCDALELIIPDLLAKGYTFVTVSELIQQ